MQKQHHGVSLANWFIIFIPCFCSKKGAETTTGTMSTLLLEKGPLKAKHGWEIPELNGGGSWENHRSMGHVPVEIHCHV